MEPIDWLIQNWLPAGKLTLLAGQAGTGKTQLAISIAAMLSSGSALPDGTISPLLNTLMWSGEDDISTVITPRFKAASAQISGSGIKHRHRRSVNGDNKTRGLQSKLRIKPAPFSCLSLRPQAWVAEDCLRIAQHLKLRQAGRALFPRQHQPKACVAQKTCGPISPYPHGHTERFIGLRAICLPSAKQGDISCLAFLKNAFRPILRWNPKSRPRTFLLLSGLARKACADGFCC